HPISANCRPRSRTSVRAGAFRPFSCSRPSKPAGSCCDNIPAFSACCSISTRGPLRKSRPLYEKAARSKTTRPRNGRHVGEAGSMADAFDYIVVGSGAGGGTLAARLAEAGRSVLLLEAGGDPRQLSGTNDYQPGINRLPDDYDVPAFHGFASENDAMRWDFFVRHYASEERQGKGPQYVRDYPGGPGNGVLYPRARTLG